MDPATFSTLFRGLGIFQLNVLKKLQYFKFGATEWLFYMSYEEYALIAMLGDDNENVRNVGLAKILARQKQVAEESANNNDCPVALNFMH